MGKTRHVSTGRGKGFLLHIDCEGEVSCSCYNIITSLLYITPLICITFFSFQPFDQAWFGAWHKRTNHLLDELALKDRIGNKEIIGCASKAWSEMFPLDDKGKVIPNRALSRAFFDAGIVPFCRTAIPDSVFLPAMSASKAMAAVRARCHIPNPSPAEAQALVDTVSPALPPIPVDIEAATRIARKSRKKVSEVLTGRAVRERKAADILAKAELETIKQRNKESRTAKRLAREAQAAERAKVRAAKAAEKVARPPKKQRAFKPTSDAKAAISMTDDIRDGAVVGGKRRAEVPLPAPAAEGSEAAPQAERKRLRLVLHKLE